MRVKICGITNTADAVAAAEAGADAIGLNFVGGPRRIGPVTAREILRALPPFVTPVALVPMEAVRLASPMGDLLAECRISHLQVYGDAGPSDLAALSAGGYRPMPVIAVRDERFGDQVGRWRALDACAPVAVVLDTYDPAREGGTGRQLPWPMVARVMAASGEAWPPIIVAGGLTPDNVAEAISVTRPYGVDVSSGVELTGSPGRKDRGKLFSFVRSARLAAGT